MHAAATAPRSLVRCKRMLGGATPPTLLGRCRTNDHRPATGERERHAIASDGLVDQARDLRTSECGRALQVNRAHLVAGPLQQFRRIRQFLTAIKVQLNAVRARADCQNALVPMRTCLPPLSLVSTAFRAEALPGPLELGCTSDDHLAADIPHPCQQAFLWTAHRLSVPAASNATRKSFVLRHASPTWGAKCSASARKSRTCAATTT